MTNLFNKLNTFFLADEDEHIELSEYIWWYGTLGILTTFLIISILMSITF